jgi:hypothetical protein
MLTEFTASWTLGLPHHHRFMFLRLTLTSSVTRISLWLTSMTSTAGRLLGALFISMFFLFRSQEGITTHVSMMTKLKSVHCRSHLTLQLANGRCVSVTYAPHAGQNSDRLERIGLVFDTPPVVVLALRLSSPPCPWFIRP